MLADENRYNYRAKNKTGNMAIHLAAIYGHLEILQLFKAKGLDMKVKG